MFDCFTLRSLARYMDHVDLSRVCCEAGQVAGCPFCTAMLAEPLRAGDEIFVLSGILEGVRAKVVEGSSLHRPGEVWLDVGEGPDMLYTFNQYRELAQRLPGLDRPKWFPPFSLPDASKLHDAILRFSASHGWRHRDDGLVWRHFYALITSVWYARLPLQADELGALLSRHGVPETFMPRLVDVYRHGRELLVCACGRRPIKKKRADYKRERRRSAPR